MTKRWDMLTWREKVGVMLRLVFSRCVRVETRDGVVAVGSGSQVYYYLSADAAFEVS